MHLPLLIPLLERLSMAPPIETYTNFPDVIKVGKQLLDKEDLIYLLGQGLLNETWHDSFGAYLELSEKARELLHTLD